MPLVVERGSSEDHVMVVVLPRLLAWLSYIITKLSLKSNTKFLYSNIFDTPSPLGSRHPSHKTSKHLLG